MTATAMLLFGSHARGDQDARSDTDLLLITQEDTPRHVMNGHVSTSFYSFEDLRSRAQNGDLFVCHIVRESIPIYDPISQLKLLRSEFRLRLSYEDEIQRATDLGWFLVDHGTSITNPSLVNKRIAWCVRTILISRSAESGKPVFSALSLAEFAGSLFVLTLIKNKDEDIVNADILRSLEVVLADFGGKRVFKKRGDYTDYRKRFVDTLNQVGLGTLRADAEALLVYQI
ncbi:anti-phage Hailong system nucleotidyltransferase HalB [Agrobacterium radiobacter]|uniref:anti-phage Hailong system nucleotidyltransferase HalB n=1 Tax=Agrobacterium radiobacter TaxID=362 RepID=UPI003F861E9E